MSVFQHTIAASFSCEGIGIHTGKNSRVEVLPASADTGIVFERTDMPVNENQIPAHHSYVSDTTRCTALANKQGASVKTVEHIMAALSAAGIDNAVVKINGPEIPVMDGSASGWHELIKNAGKLSQDKPQKTLRVLKPVTVGDGKRWLTIEPNDTFAIDIQVDYQHPAINTQQASFDSAKDDFGIAIAKAKTFAFKHEIDKLQKAGIGKGGSLQNTIVLDDNRIMNPEIVTYPDDELARHKILDIIGDTALAGMPIAGKITGYAPGHSLTHELMTSLIKEKGAWEIANADNQAHSSRANITKLDTRQPS